jgi:uncharacterized protein YkwD
MKSYLLTCVLTWSAVCGVASTAQADTTIKLSPIANSQIRSAQLNNFPRSTQLPTRQPSNAAPLNNSPRSTTQLPIASKPSSSVNSEANSLEKSVFEQINRYRASKNLPPLTVDPAVAAVAKRHSDEMARTGNMSHEGFSERAESVAKTIVYRSTAENVAYNMGYAKPDAAAIQGWIESPDLTGVGVSRNAKGEYYFTQIFVRKAWYVKDADRDE